jgi:hypothetical protein
MPSRSCAAVLLFGLVLVASSTALPDLLTFSAGEGGIVIADADSAGGAPSANLSASSSFASALKSKCETYLGRHMLDDSFRDSIWRERGASYFGRVNDLESTCPSRSSNAHGSYTSRGKCYFKFHKIHNESRVLANRMSVACSDDNLVVEEPDEFDDHHHRHDDGPVRHPVKNWPDACVGDFARCYRLHHDEDKLLKFICSKRLEVPEGATHLSVDCTSDKAALKEMKKRGELDEDLMVDPNARRQQKERREHYAFVVGMTIMLLAFVSACLVLVHRYAFQPYLKAVKRSRSDPELFGLASRQQALLNRP